MTQPGKSAGEAETASGRAGRTVDAAGRDDAALPAGSDEEEEIQERARLSTPAIYEIVRREGDAEMARPVTSLWWSGVAAGLSISFSLLAQAILYTGLPDAPWRPLVSSAGYTVGFLMVVLGRQQLFTENTITVVLPVMAEPTLAKLASLGRIWGIVLLANLAGTLFAALFCSFTPVLSPPIRAAMLEISGHLMTHGRLDMFFRGISSGFLIAAMVWMLPSAGAAQFAVVTVMTYLIGVGDFTHIVAGSVEAFLLMVNGQLSLTQMVADFAVPVLTGNVVGGTALFTLLSYAQVMDEL
jgi:formate/nitrite transporter FocA (FNT family)